jgi:tetratricopeptide (TPR) repeat protein
MSDNKEIEGSFDKVDDLSDSDDEKKAAPETPALSKEEAVNIANIMKDVGNTSFKASNIPEALSSYSEAITALNKLSDDDKKSKDINDLLVSLNGNKAMCHVKTSEWTLAKSSANEVLRLDRNNVKALYRRGLSYHKLSSLDEAKSDLTKVLELDNNNIAAKKELFDVEKAIKVYAKQERAAMSNMFSSGKSMYEDKEKERLLKIRKEEEKEAKLKDDWTKEKISRRAQGKDDELSFEDYKKDIEDKEKERKKEAEREEKERRKKARTSEPSSSSTSSKPKKVSVNKKSSKDKDDSSDDDDDDDEDLKELKKGYKTTSDGRKTSYFNNELDENTKALIGDIAPKPISASMDSSISSVTDTGNTANTNANSNGFAPKSIPNNTEQPSAGSVWNHAGTFEEKDMSKWAINNLTDILSSIKYSMNGNGTCDSLLNGSIFINITKVKDLNGDAEIIVSRGKTRYLYDFTCELEYDVILTAFDINAGLGDTTDKKYKGSIKITDISPDMEAEYNINMKKSIAPEFKQRVHNATEVGLISAIKEKLVEFDSAYKASQNK